MTKVQIYTDGSARGNPDGPGGYGTVLHFTDSSGQLHEKTMSGGYVRTTNNRMELMAAIVGLEALNRPCQVELYSDSKYLTDAFNQHWIDSWVAKGWNRGKSGPVKNIDLWKRLLKAKEPHQGKNSSGVKRTCARQIVKMRMPDRPWHSAQMVRI